LRDELILALDLYMREGRNPSGASKDELSATLRSIPIEPELAENPKFRNRPGVSLKVSNFAAIDPNSSIKGMPHGGHGDQEVWDEFGDNPRRLHETAAAIRANLGNLTVVQAEADEDEVTEAQEGRILTRVHRVRERDAKLRQARRQKALDETGVLSCEVCGFDFEGTYGERGKSFIECHHIKAVSALRPGEKTRLEDLALLCSNCHRMIHVRRPWLSLDELRECLPPQDPATPNGGGDLIAG
jgi:5-methylcytosine-specific restriction protein A